MEDRDRVTSFKWRMCHVEKLIARFAPLGEHVFVNNSKKGFWQEQQLSADDDLETYLIINVNEILAGT